MRPCELMIGDWVFDIANDCYWQHNIKDYRCEERILSEFEPIKLTAEILEMNGFEKKENWRYVCFSIEEGYSLCYNNLLKSLDAFHTTFIKGYTNRRAQLSKHIEYVHELQHAMRFLGIDKEIVL